MLFLRFCVEGNQEDPTGNPVPYVRTTQRGKWSPQFKRYLRFKDYIRLCANRAALAGHAHGCFPAGAAKGEQIVVDLRIEFKGRQHGDPDNVIKTVLDTLFEQDKRVTPRLYGVKEGESCGRVWVVVHGPYPSDEYVTVSNQATP